MLEARPMEEQNLPIGWFHARVPIARTRHCRIADTADDVIHDFDRGFFSRRSIRGRNSRLYRDREPVSDDSSETAGNLRLMQYHPPRNRHDDNITAYVLFLLSSSALKNAQTCFYLVP